MGLEELWGVVLLGFPVLHHVMDCLHTIEDKDEDQEDAVEECG